MRSASLLRHLLTCAGRVVKPANACRPTVVPYDRQPPEVKPAECYEHDAAVWAYISGLWRMGRVVEGAEAWVLVRYHTPGSGDIAVEALAAPYVMDRRPSG